MVKNVLLSALLVGAIISSSGVASAKTPEKPSQTKLTPVVPGVIYVQYKAGSRALSAIHTKGSSSMQSVGGDRYDRIIRSLGVTEVVAFDAQAAKDPISKSLGIDRIFAIYYSNTSIDPHTAVRRLLETSEVEEASCRYMFPLSLQPNDARIGEQYALSNMSVFKAWDYTCGDSNIVIADVDCATNIDHEDLKAEVKYNTGEVGLDANGNDKRTNGKDDDGDGYVDNWRGWDVVGNGGAGAPFRPDNDPRPDTSLAIHGTLTAGCIVATGNNNKGIAGIAFGCRLLPIKASNARYSSYILGGYEGIHYAVTHGAKVVNCSWGGPIANEDVTLADVFLREAVSRNSLIVCASGNEGKNVDVSPDYPGAGPGVLSVGSTGSTDAASNFGNYGHSVSVFAPGENILSTTYPGNSSYLSENGTSFASPLTAGVAALVFSQHPTWLPAFVARQVIQTCDNVISPANRYAFWGRVNAEQAVSKQQWPGLIETQYTLNGVVNDSLERPGIQQDFKVILKNVVATGSNIMARLVPAPGYSTTSQPILLGTIGLNSTSEASFKITRTDEYTSGILPVKIYVYDQSALADTITVYAPMKVVPGFSTIERVRQGSSLRRVDNRTAWASFGADQSTGTLVSNYANQIDGLWDSTYTLDDGTQPPYCVEATDADHVWFGTSLSSASNVISSDDGGASFGVTSVSSITPFVNAIHFFDANNGIFIGDPLSSRWGIAVTSDAGGTWKKIAKAVVAPSGEASWNNGAAWVGQNGWFGTNKNHIWRSSDAGQTWKSVTTPQPNALSVAFASDAMHGFACCRPVYVQASNTFNGINALLYTSDGGNNWREISRPDTMAPGSVQFIPDTNIAIFTSNSGIYRTDDYGTTWSRIPMPLTFNAEGAAIDISRDRDSVEITALSTTVGLISYTMPMAAPVRTVAQGAATVRAELDVVPNPAQSVSSVTIRHDRLEHIKLMVADVLGREVATLIDREIGAGAESVKLNALGLSAGTYYVVLETGSGERIVRTISIEH